MLSGICIMFGKSGSTSPTLKEIAKTFRMTGWLSLWIQLVLTVVSSIILIFAGALSRSGGANQNSPTTGIGVLVTIFGIAVLVFNMYWGAVPLYSDRAQIGWCSGQSSSEVRHDSSLADWSHRQSDWYFALSLGRRGNRRLAGSKSIQSRHRWLCQYRSLKVYPASRHSGRASKHQRHPGAVFWHCSLTLVAEPDE